MSIGNGQTGSIQNSVYTALRKSIINLNLEPGASISEKEVSLKYNVSRTPVREAFIHLANEGLIHVIPQKETLISRIDFVRVNQEFFLRDVLETAVYEPFIARYTPLHIAQLEASIELQQEELAQNDYVGFMLQDNSFHRIFFEGAGEGLAWSVLESQSGHYFRVRLLTTWLTGIAATIIDQHKNILSALKEKDLTAARGFLNAHIHKLSDEEAMLRQNFPAYFVDPNAPNAFEADFGGLTFGSPAAKNLT
jgi:DNA-binding GntR family transcriptional regulator